LFRWSLELSFTYVCFWLSRRVTKCRTLSVIVRNPTYL
jgi:hypothetical protein